MNGASESSRRKMLFRWIMYDIAAIGVLIVGYVLLFLKGVTV